MKHAATMIDMLSVQRDSIRPKKTVMCSLDVITTSHDVAIAQLKHPMLSVVPPPVAMRIDSS
eukprot:9788404-Ditylum_brightwellii.AAC.1